MHARHHHSATGRTTRPHEPSDSLLTRYQTRAAAQPLARVRLSDCPTILQGYHPIPLQ